MAPETAPTSYVTTVWPSLGTLLDLERQGCPSGRYPAIELARGRQMVVRNWERVSVEWDESGASAAALLKSAAGSQAFAADGGRCDHEPPLLKCRR